MNALRVDDLIALAGDPSPRSLARRLGITVRELTEAKANGASGRIERVLEALDEALPGGEWKLDASGRPRPTSGKIQLAEEIREQPRLW